MERLERHMTDMTVTPKLLAKTGAICSRQSRPSAISSSAAVDHAVRSIGLARRGRLAAHRCSMAAKRSAAEAAASEEAPGFAARFLGYINETPTPFHLCAVTAAKLQSAGFSELSESDAWASSGSVVAGGKYFYTRCASSRASTVRSVRC